MVDARHDAFRLEDTGTENPVPRTNILVQPQAACSKLHKLVADSIFGRRLRRKSVPQNVIVTFNPNQKLNGHDRFFNLLFHLPLTKDFVHVSMPPCLRRSFNIIPCILFNFFHLLSSQYHLVWF